ncbi:MAG: hypothetical protein J6A08_07355 [Lachnospiraceae bacterium]|nr:hypothetical protein [Lachnospiraceae bacterium]
MVYWLADNWMVLVGIGAAAVLAVSAAYRFLGMPTEKQQAKVKEWLIWACIEAEKALQIGTGQAKLRKVYEAFVSIPAFSWIARVISFDTFSEWVNDALAEAKVMMINSGALAKYVYGENADSEVERLRIQIRESI